MSWWDSLSIPPPVTVLWNLMHQCASICTLNRQGPRGRCDETGIVSPKVLLASSYWVQLPTSENRNEREGLSPEDLPGDHPGSSYSDLFLACSRELLRLRLNQCLWLNQLGVSARWCRSKPASGNTWKTNGVTEKGRGSMGRGSMRWSYGQGVARRFFWKCSTFLLSSVALNWDSPPT